MSLVRFLIILAIGTVTSWLAWGLVINTMDPANGGAVALLLFYGSLTLAIFGTVTLAGFFLRYWLERDTVLFRQIGVAMRHGTILTVMAVVLLLLQSQRVLNLWSIIALLALAVVIELFFVAGQSKRTVTE